MSVVQDMTHGYMGTVSLHEYVRALKYPDVSADTTTIALAPNICIRKRVVC